ncbi:MAG: hypothetical protein ABI665_08420 [Vicinamibacterales bacterium]
MTAAREAFGLPAVFLTVFLLGALRIGDAAVLVPPSPFALVLGALLLRVVVQSGALAPERLLSSARSGLANANGLVVLVVLWAAAAQVIAVLIPESGVPQIAFSVFFFVLLLNTAAAAPDRERLLRSLAVTLGSAFVLKFVVLYQLSTPRAGALKRMLQAILDSVTLGALIQAVPHPIAAYLALLSLVVFLVGLVLLPHRDQVPPRRLLRPSLP